MSAKTKIFVFKMKELIYAGILAALAVLLIILLVIMFLPDKENTDPVPSQAASYIPGKYTSSITLNNQALDVEVTVDANQITSVQFVNLNAAVTAVYPMMESVLENIESQVLEKQSLDSITYPDDMKYTSAVLIETIQEALDKASVS
ncbi:MAG: hypothetical protein ACLU6W_12295 [Lachnospiraceae bacterium]|nr:hypothetical protein [Candidatus Fimimorpha excrementavium]